MKAKSTVSPTDPLAGFHPIVREWFTETLGAPSPPQIQGWPVIASGDHALILAPTGTGKTLAAFLWELNALIVEGLAAPLANGVHLLYVSPLKALNNDIQRNLERPLAELRRRFEQAGLAFPEIRVAVRTGDTPASQRQRMIRKSPHILITTPESLNIMLTSLRGRGMFASTRTVILDEIHAVAGTKRGAHLAVTMERLVQLTPTSEGPQRIGLSATQRPLDEIARFLGGTNRKVSSRGLRTRQGAAAVGAISGSGSRQGRWQRLAFSCTARAERNTQRSHDTRVREQSGAGRAYSSACEHTGGRGDRATVSRFHSARTTARAGTASQGRRAACTVTTSSLELGIDIGSVDLVIQLQSPKRVSAALQRVGRAGHTLGVASRGVFVPTFRDDAMETAAIVAAMRAGEVEPTRVVQNALDVLGAGDSRGRIGRRLGCGRAVRARPAIVSVPRTATCARIDEVVAMLSGKYPSEVAAELEARITFDRATNRLTGITRERE